MLTTFVDDQRHPFDAAAAQRLLTLTDREREVATAVETGASNAEVATALYMVPWAAGKRPVLIEIEPRTVSGRKYYSPGV